MQIGKLGLWTFQLRGLDEGQLRDTLAEIETIGYGAVWFPGGSAGGAFAHARALLDSSSRLVVATGILSIWDETASTIAGHHRSLRQAHPGRFLLGLGVSHPEAVNRGDSSHYRRPLQAMTSFLDDLDAADPHGATGERVLAALGPKMLELAATRAWGAHPYFVPAEHTQLARERLGPSAVLAPEQAVLLETDPARAREIARGHMSIYLGLVNYTSNLRRLGFTDDDLAGGGSDRLVDAIVAWGDEERVAGRVRAHHEAGADHVCVQVLSDDVRRVPLAEWRRLAEAVAA